MAKQRKVRSEAQSKGKSKAKLDVGEHQPGLTHNPFAALKGLATEPSWAQASGSEPQVHGDAGEDAAIDESAGTPEKTHEIEIRHEKKGRGGKVVTLVTWRRQAPDGPELVALARRVARRLGAGARASAEGFVVQGDLKERVATALEAELKGAVRITFGTR